MASIKTTKTHTYYFAIGRTVALGENPWDIPAGAAVEVVYDPEDLTTGIKFTWEGPMTDQEIETAYIDAVMAISKNVDAVNAELLKLLDERRELRAELDQFRYDRGRVAE